MRSQFSELSYAYALTDNLIHACGLSVGSAPSFPSTYKEGKVGGGHDVKLDLNELPLFLQFKLSDRMSNRSATEFKSGRFDHVVNGCREPVYRMHLHALGKSRQTSLLLKLEKRNYYVYYVAPLFGLPSELSDFYRMGTVPHHSRFIKPSSIKKMPDKLHHFVSFRAFGKAYRFSNEPLEIDAVETYAEVIERVRSDEDSAPFSLYRIVSDMIQIINDEALDSAISDQDQSDEDGKNYLAQNPETSEVDADIARINLFAESDMPLRKKAEVIARNFFGLELLTLRQ